MTRAARLLILAGLLGACGDPTIPPRTAPYPFAQAGSGDVFRWPQSYQPVRYWADPRGALPRLVTQGIARWESQFLYGEFAGIVVPDSLDADVVVVWGGPVPPDVPPDPGPPVNACSGVTQFTLDSTNTATERVRARVNALGGFSDAQIAACVERVTVHELGHTIGLLQHSPDPLDVMTNTPAVRAPSDRDRRTAEVLYHSAPTIFPRPRP